MGKYDQLRPLFEDATEDSFILSFEDLEKALGQALPGSARRHVAWWAPSQRNSVWADYGFRATPDLEAGTALFTKGLEAGSTSSSVSSAESHDVSLRVQWDDYDSWNKAIHDEFFTGSWAGRPVYLDLDDPALEKVGEEVRGDSTDIEAHFINAIVNTLVLDSVGVGTFTAHVERLRSWRAAEQPNVPPFLALLGFFSRVADQMRSGDGLSSSNYLGRLGDAVGLDRDDIRGRNKLSRDFRRQSHSFWNALNSWLDEAGGSLGISTARVFDWRVHVGLPISQALVKEADRERFKNLFSRYGFTGGENLSTTDMKRLLDGWIRNSPISPYVKRIWDSGVDGKNRIAEIAAVELASWDGTTPREELRAEKSQPIRLAALIRNFPRRRIELGFVAKPSDFTSTSLTPIANSEEIRSIVGDQSAGYSLIDDVGAGWMTLRSETELSIPDSLLIGLIFVNEDGQQLRRSPRGVVVLHEDEDSGLLIETERIQLATDAYVLTHGALRDEVAETLESAARPGYQVVEPSECIGLPDDWVLFESVQLLATPEPGNENLNPLIPIAWSQVSFGAGFSLPGPGFYHSAHPPEVRVSALDHEKGFVQLSEQDFADDGTTSKSLGTVEGSGVYNLSDLGIDDGDYVISVSERPDGGGKTIISGSFRLRSSARPRFAGLETLGHDLFDSRASSPITATLIEPGDSGSMLRGAFAPSMPAVDVDRSDMPARSMTAPSRQWSPEDDVGPPQVTETRVGAGPTCAIGGGHHWMLPTATGDRQWDRWMEGYCKRCNMIKLFPTRPRWKRDRDSRSSGAAIEPDFSPSSVGPVRDEDQIGIDTLFDGVCFAQAGSWASLRKLASQYDDSPWFSLEFARTLSSLGHVDLALDRHGLRPVRFAVAPPVLASLPGGGVALCGFRNQSVKASVLSAAAELGLRTEVTQHSSAPESVVVDIDEAGAEQVIAELASDYAETTILGCPQPSARLASALPRLSEVRGWLPPIDPPSAVVERFDPYANSWAKANATGEPGAYRFQTRPLSYGVRWEDGTMVRADNHWAKWLAANTMRVEIFAYDPERRVVTVPIGARLPGLYERAVVLSSGLPPSDVGQTTRYERVESGLAATVHAKLMS